MPLERRLLLSQSIPNTGAAAHGAGPAVSGTFAVRAQALLVVLISATEDTDTGFDASALTISDSAGKTWTVRATTPNPIGWSHGIRAWTAPVAQKIAAMTITADAGAFVIHAYKIEVFEYTGHHPTAPVGATAVGTDPDGDGAGSLTLSAAPLETSDVLAAAFVSFLVENTGGTTPGSGWTEISDFTIPTSAGNQWGNTQTQVRTNSTSTAVDWVDLHTGAGPVEDASLLAIEIVADPSPISPGGSKQLTDVDLAAISGDDNFQAEATNLSAWFRNDLKIAA